VFEILWGHQKNLTQPVDSSNCTHKTAQGPMATIFHEIGVRKFYKKKTVISDQCTFRFKVSIIHKNIEKLFNHRHDLMFPREQFQQLLPICPVQK
jgi:hypothetical protein